MNHQFTIEPVAEAVALTKRCTRNPAMTCAASGCMAWANVAAATDSKTIALPPQIAAKHNADNAAYFAACLSSQETGEPVPDEMSPDDGALMAWVSGLVETLGADGWQIEGGADIGGWLSDWYDGGWLEGELSAGDIALTFERPKGEAPRGICAHVARRY